MRGCAYIGRLMDNCGCCAAADGDFPFVIDRCPSVQFCCICRYHDECGCLVLTNRGCCAAAGGDAGLVESGEAATVVAAALEHLSKAKDADAAKQAWASTGVELKTLLMEVTNLPRASHTHVSR